MNDLRKYILLSIIILLPTSMFLLNACGGAAEENGDNQPDGQEEVVDGDADNDGVLDGDDNCPNDSNAAQLDDDNDGVGDVCDNCIGDKNADQVDSDGDGLGDVCDGPLPTLCDPGVTECAGDEDCGANQFCKSDGCCEENPDVTETFSCTDHEAHPFSNCEDLPLSAGATEETKNDPEYANLDCSDFGLRGTCLDRNPENCCGVSTCQYVGGATPKKVGFSFTCSTYEEEFREFFGGAPFVSCTSWPEPPFYVDGSPFCQDTADPKGELPNQECCLVNCTTGVVCTLPDEDRDPNVVCQEEIHQSSVCELSNGCCSPSCNGDPSKECTEGSCTPPEICRDGCCKLICGGDLSKECVDDGDCTNPEVCNSGCCGTCKDTCTVADDCRGGSEGNQCNNGCCRPL